MSYSPNRYIDFLQFSVSKHSSFLDEKSLILDFPISGQLLPIHITRIPSYLLAESLPLLLRGESLHGLLLLHHLDGFL